jgi:hypothetical protein
MRAFLLVIGLMALADASPPPPPGPAEIWDHAVEAARAERAACHVAGALGDVVVELRGTTWSASPSRSLGSAGGKIATCVKDAIAKHLHGYTGNGDSHTEAIGVPHVVLPAASKLIAAWRRGARGELAKLLPPDHSLTKDLCISADRRYAATAMMLWMPSAGPWVPRMWDALLAKTLSGAANPVMWDPAGGFITQGQRGLCYVPFDAAKQRALRTEMDTLGSCWAGTFEEVLLHPHVAFPAKTTYTQVSTNHGRACALDAAGTVTCCGRNEPALPAAPTGLVSIATGYGFACGLDKRGSIRCWGTIAAPPAGTFTKISAEYQHACAVATNGTVSCWGAGNYGIAQPPKGTFVDVAASQFSTCGIHKDGSAECWGEPRRAKHPPGSFLAVAANWTHACGLRRDHTIGCWSNDGDPVTSPTPEKVDAIVVGDAYQVCGRRLDHTVACWGATQMASTKLLPLPSVKLAQISGDQNMFCGVGDDGSIACWGEKWPGSWLGDNTWPYTPQLLGLSRPTPPVLRGRIVDETGAPIAGAEVLGCGERMPCTFLYRNAHKSAGSLRDQIAAMTPPPNVTIATTAADGTWSLGPSLHDIVVATAPGREIVQQTVRPGGDVMLRPASSLEIRPRCGRSACAGKITISLGDYDRVDGTRLEHLAPGTYAIDVTENRGLAGERSDRVTVDIGFVAKAQQLDVPLAPSGTGKSIRGTAQVDGTPGPVRVIATCGTTVRRADADAKGAFEIKDVGAPPCTVEIYSGTSTPVTVTKLPATGIQLHGESIQMPEER